MKVLLDPNPPEIECLFAVERELVPEPDDIRNRAIVRARASLPRNPWMRHPSRNPKARLVTLRGAAVAAVMLSALCAGAFYAGYHIKNRNPAALSSAPVVVPPLPETPPVSVTATRENPTLVEPRPTKSKAVGSTKSATDGEAYAMELRVLQPARQAVARYDFSSALAAISEHQHRFPSGKLTEEREALRVKALLGLGRVAEAQSAGAAFREHFPRSALLGRIDEMLGTRR